uniref:Uncharacterized protein n=1 Tax=Marseillevirus LCMAC103 TaxID=2506604 RepID=A0A481YV12_9VIRU|nr:MAG: uncharacterized protein LCMAC103_02790 [Marseillevirus LCMAC103]
MINEIMAEILDYLVEVENFEVGFFTDAMVSYCECSVVELLRKMSVCKTFNNKVTDFTSNSTFETYDRKLLENIRDDVLRIFCDDMDDDPADRTIESMLWMMAEDEKFREKVTLCVDEKIKSLANAGEGIIAQVLKSCGDDDTTAKEALKEMLNMMKDKHFFTQVSNFTHCL